MNTNCVHCTIQNCSQHGGDFETRVCKVTGKFCYYDSVWQTHEEKCETYKPINDPIIYRENEINRRIANMQRIIRDFEEEKLALRDPNFI